MKIYGFGVDITNINRLQKSLKNNKKIMNRLFTKKEIKFCISKKNKFSCFAKRFAAKEAFSKALGIGITKGLSFNEIEVVKNKYKKPSLKIIGQSKKILYEILKEKKYKIFLSISDEPPFALASVILTT